MLKITDKQCFYCDETEKPQKEHSLVNTVYATKRKLRSDITALVSVADSLGLNTTSELLKAAYESSF